MNTQTQETWFELGVVNYGHYRKAGGTRKYLNSSREIALMGKKLEKLRLKNPHKLYVAVRIDQAKDVGDSLEKPKQVENGYYRVLAKHPSSYHWYSPRSLNQGRWPIPEDPIENATTLVNIHKAIDKFLDDRGDAYEFRILKVKEFTYSEDIEHVKLTRTTTTLQT